VSMWTIVEVVVELKEQGYCEPVKIKARLQTRQAR
jgi:hypothetical protein